MKQGVPPPYFARRDGKTVHTSHFSLRTLPDADLHFSPIVSKKVAKTAVLRNKLKRRMREVLRAELARTSKGIYILYAKKGAPGVTYADMQREVRELLGV